MILRAALATLTALVLAAGSAHAATRYAAPDGDGPEPCTKANPCSLTKAIKDAPVDGDTVAVAAGTYAVADPIFTSKQMTIEGPVRGKRPVIAPTSALNAPTLSLGSSSAEQTVVRHLDLRGNTIALLLHARTTVSHSTVSVAGKDRIAISLEGLGVTIDNTFARGLGEDAVGIRVYNGANELHNVTTVGQGPGASGIQLYATCFGGVGGCMQGTAPSVALTNSIASGTAYDIAFRVDAGATASATARYSNFDSANGTVQDGGGNQSDPPTFVPAGFPSFDYHQKAGSPTIDAGIADPESGTSDIDYNARTLGAAPDIGADEFVPPQTPGGGGGPGGGGVDPADATAPVVTKLATSPRAFRRAKGADILYELSEPSALALRVARCRKGCKRVRMVKGKLSHDATEPTGSFHFDGKVGGKRLRPGRYRLIARATDSAGNRSAARRARFRVKR